MRDREDALVYALQFFTREGESEQDCQQIKSMGPSWLVRKDFNSTFEKVAFSLPIIQIRSQPMRLG